MPQEAWGSISDLGARVYERRTGTVVAERVFPSPDRDGCDAREASLGMRNAEPGARWAWDELRLSR